MLVSVVIPVFNREDFIERCLHSVLDQDFKEEYEVIVIDDGSYDATKEKIAAMKDPRIAFHSNGSNQGLSFSRNIGVSLARGEVVAFTDSDCIVDRQWLEELLRPFMLDADTMIVGGKIKSPPSRGYWSMVNQDRDFIAAHNGYVAQIRGCNMAFRKKFLEDNPFDERLLLAADDWDICERCHKQNKKVYYTQEALVTHYQRNGFKATLTQQFCYGYSIAYFKIRHRQFPFISYGSCLLLAAFVSWMLGWGNKIFDDVASLCFFGYLLLGAYWNSYGRSRGWRQWLSAYPGFMLRYSAFCTGHWCFPIVFSKTKHLKAEAQISVCTLVWDGLDFTKRFLKSLRSNRSIIYELVIVDNGSLPSTSVFLAEQTEHYFKFEGNQGFGKGFNKAVQMAGCKYILLTNNDTVWPLEDWGRELVAEYESLDNCGLLIPCTNNILLEGNKRKGKGDKIIKTEPWSKPNCAGVAFFLKRDIFLQVGGFSGEFSPASGEDLDFQCKIWKAGYDIYVTEKVFVRHIGKATSHKLPHREELWHKNYLLFQEKWKQHLKA